MTLVQKKNPLAMPPDYEKLPIPKSQEDLLQNKVEDSSEIKSLLELGESNDNQIGSETSEDIEDSILEKIQ